MKKKKKYEKPRIEFHDLQLKEEIAEECWSGARSNKGYTWYYDTEGAGYVSFQMKDNCTYSICNVFYYPKKDAAGIEIKPDDPLYSKQYSELENSIKKYGGGNNGTAFKGLKTGLFPNGGPGSNFS